MYVFKLVKMCQLGFFQVKSSEVCLLITSSGEEVKGQKMVFEDTAFSENLSNLADRGTRVEEYFPGLKEVNVYFGISKNSVF